jgi:hypothetical protein
VTKKKPPDEPRGKPGRPPGGQGPKKNATCENGHTSNTYGQCFESSCEHYVRKGL